MALLYFLYSLALVGLLFSCSSSKPVESTTQDQTDMAERIEWVDVHVHLVGGRRGRVHDYGGAARVALKAMDEASIRMSVVMPPPQPPRVSGAL